MKCPICACEEVVESRAKGIGKYLLPYTPLTQFRCLNCWYRFWGFRNPILKAVYLSLMVVLVAAAAYRFYSFSMDGVFFGKDPPAPAERGETRHAPPEDPSGASSSTLQDASRHGASAAGGWAASRGPSPQAPPMESGSLALRIRPDETAAVRFFMEKGSSYSVIHRQGRWAVVQLTDGTVGWARQDGLRTWAAKEDGKPAETAAVPPMLRPEEVASSGPAGIAAEEETAAGKSAAVHDAAGEVPDEVMVRVDIGRVRNSASIDAPVVFRVLENEVVTVLDRRGDWFKVRHGSGWSGWAHESLFASDVPEMKTATLPGQASEPDAAAAAAGKVVKTARETPSDTAGKREPAGAPAADRPTAPARLETAEERKADREVIVAVNRGRVRRAPSLGAPVLFLVEKDQRFPVVGTKGDWLQLRVGSAPGGWAHKSLFAQTGAFPQASAPETGRIQIDEDGREDRKQTEDGSRADEPRASAVVLAPSGTDASEGAVVAVLPDAGKANSGEKTMQVVGVDVGLVRAAPSEAAPVQFRLYGNEEVTAIDVRGDWIRIRRVNGWIGWAHQSLLAEKDPENQRALSAQAAMPGPTATVAVDVGLVREAPSPEAARVCRLVREMTVQVMAEENDWLQIRMVNGWTGWAHRSLFAEPAAGEGR